MRTYNAKAIGVLAALVILVPLAAAAEDTAVPYASATEAYRQGNKAIKAGQPLLALPAFEYAAQRGVLGAQLKLARIYAAGDAVAEDDAKAFSYYRQIADQQADISPRSPIAKYVAEAFVALGQYHLDGIAAISLSPNHGRAAGLFRHAASYFGDAEAQYRLAQLYLSGEGVNRNPDLAVNWLAAAAKKQHAASQGALGELLWRGEDVRRRPARGLALITLAHENAKAGGKEPAWIERLYAEVIKTSDADTRQRAQAMLPSLGGPAIIIVREAEPAQVTAGSSGQLVLPATPKAPAAPAEDSPVQVNESLPPTTALPPSTMGVSLGFGGELTVEP